MKILVTGGAGFIGSALIRYLLAHTSCEVINLDKLTYASSLESLSEVSNDERYVFEKIDICNSEAVRECLYTYKPNMIMHLAAESHVDRSIDGPVDFLNTNILGTFHMLETSKEYYKDLSEFNREAFKFHHVSTDEVFGDLSNSELYFTEETAYAPTSPYSASKASSDHLVRAWGRTYNLPFVITNCSNNYGPYHFPEKLIPHMILNLIYGKPLPVYGDGSQIRDWLYVDDHVRALVNIAFNGKSGETYNIGGHNEKTNLEVVETICDLMEELAPEKPEGIERYRDLITFVSDRPGHDYRYAIDASKIQKELGWIPLESFETGMRKTVIWYLENRNWWKPILSGDYELKRLGK